MRRFSAFNSLPLLLLAIAVYLWQASSLMFVQDDAYITLAYARNILSGHGPVFNPGEYVEGFTSLLWLLLSVVVQAVSSDPATILQLFGLTLGGITLGVLWFSISELGKGQVPQLASWTASMVVLFIAVTPAFAYWCSSAMEFPLFCLLLVLFIYCIVTEDMGKRIGFVLTALVIVRPESLLLLSSFIVFTTIYHRRSLMVTALPTVVALSIFIGRFFVYGELLPNTFSAKTGSIFLQMESGLQYILLYLYSPAVMGLIPVASVIGAIKNTAPSIRYLTTTALIWLASVLLLGGDVLHHQRFALPFHLMFLPGAAVGIYWVWKKAWSGRSQMTGYGLLVAIVLFAALSERNNIVDTRDLEEKLVSKMRRYGKWLSYNQHIVQWDTTRPLRIAASTIGAIKFYSNAVVIDMLGLTDTHIAHQPESISALGNVSGIAGWKERKYNAEYVLNREPDVIIFSTGLKPSAWAERALFAREVWVDYYHYYFPVPGARQPQVLLRRKPPKVIESQTLRRKGLTHRQIEALQQYPDLITLTNQPGGSPRVISGSTGLLTEGITTFSHIHVLLGDEYLNTGDIEQARTWYMKAVETDPTTVRAHYMLIQMAEKNRDTSAIAMHGDWLRRLNPFLLADLGYDIR